MNKKNKKNAHNASNPNHMKDLSFRFIDYISKIRVLRYNHPNRKVKVRK